LTVERGPALTDFRPLLPLALLRGLPASARYLLAFALMPATVAAGLPVLGSFGIYWNVCPIDPAFAAFRLAGFWALLLAVVAIPSRLLRVDSTYLMFAVAGGLLAWLAYTRLPLAGIW
jgi:hypothetical protein